MPVYRQVYALEAISLEDISAETVATAFVREYASTYGVPLRLTSDPDHQFISTLFENLTQLLGADHIQTTGYHLEVNDILKR